MIFDQQLLHAPALAHNDLDLDAAQRVTYLLEQSFRYDYDRPVEALRHRLVVLPPAQHGNQYRRAHRVQIAGAQAQRQMRRDVHGNTVLRLHAARVERTVTFRVEALVERVVRDGGTVLPASALDDPRLLRPTRLTTADERIRELARAVAADVGGGGDAALGAALCRRVHAELRYEYGITTVSTTAAEALAGGRGVCQDSAHVMLALCHVLALPARYVSGHLLGQGGTHAWVEVIVGSARDGAVALPFDPCNGVPGSARYLTVATGRDYRDVAPTSGSYRGSAHGQLTTSRRVAVLAAA